MSPWTYLLVIDMVPVVVLLFPRDCQEGCPPTPALAAHWPAPISYLVHLGGASLATSAEADWTPWWTPWTLHWWDSDVTWMMHQLHSEDTQKSHKWCANVMMIKCQYYNPDAMRSGCHSVDNTVLIFHLEVMFGPHCTGISEIARMSLCYDICYDR